ncbi:MAG: DUF861 domain-containing protein [Alphaproteobacteria bacterium]|nr:DUF861 domain-containing protein [Alphaproteobacteria bacterium]
MKKILLTATALAWASAAMAQSAMAQSLHMPSNVVPGASVKEVSMAEWEVKQAGAAEQTGARILIAAGDDELKNAPADATKYGSKTFKFPSGDIRVLTFKKDQGGVLHQITSETVIYVVKGSAEVGVIGKPTTISAGDVVSLPSGNLRSRAGAAEDTTVVAFTVGHTEKNPKAAVVRAKDTPEQAITAGPKAGTDAAKVAVRRYMFPGNTVRVAGVTGPGKTNPATPKADVLLYLTSGKATVTIGGETREVAAGDAVREPAGVEMFWDVKESMSFVATDAPAAAPQAK